MKTNYDMGTHPIPRRSGAVLATSYFALLMALTLDSFPRFAVSLLVPMGAKTWPFTLVVVVALMCSMPQLLLLPPMIAVCNSLIGKTTRYDMQLWARK